MVNMLFKPLSATRVHLVRQNPLRLAVLQSGAATRNYCFLSSLGRRALLLGGGNDLHRVELSSGHAPHFQRKLEDSISTGCSFRFSHIRSAHVNDPGSIDSPLMMSMEKKVNTDCNPLAILIAS